MIEYEGGTKRADRKAYYKNIPFSFIKRLAQTYKEGAEKYDEAVDESNWKKGDKKFFAEAFDHCIEHLYLFLDGDRTEDHLAHAAANIGFLVWAEERGIWDPNYSAYPHVKEPFDAFANSEHPADEEEPESDDDEIEEVPEHTEGQGFFARVFSKLKEPTD